jgi:hypothetical protein
MGKKQAIQARKKIPKALYYCIKGLMYKLHTTKYVRNFVAILMQKYN